MPASALANSISAIQQKSDHVDICSILANLHNRNSDWPAEYDSLIRCGQHNSSVRQRENHGFFERWEVKVAAILDKTMYRIVNEFLRPYTLLVLISACSGIWAHRRRESRWALQILLVSLFMLVVLSIPAVSYLTFLTLEARSSPLAEVPAGTEAIVVLSGGLWPPTPKEPRALPGEDTIYRCLATVELYRSRPCLVVVSGGITEPSGDAPPLAFVMSDFLVQLGVNADDIVLEDRSRTTYENAVESKQILQQLGRRRVVLVTEALHMPRAATCFRRVGLEVTEAPCHFITGRFEWAIDSFLPSPGAARGEERVVHEWLGILWYWLKDKI